MAAKPVLLYPDPLLKRRCSPIADPGEIARVATDLIDAMRSQPRCVGLAAPQIAELVRVAVVDVSGHPKAKSCGGLLVLVNPSIVRAAGEELGREGCLSVPELTANVQRASIVEIEARNLAGEPFSVTAKGFEARALQHELDHLDGILFLDRISSKQDLFRRRSYG